MINQTNRQRLMVEGWNKYRGRCLMLVNRGFVRQLFQHSEGNNCVGVVHNPAMFSIARCAVMGATRRCPQICCRPKTDWVITVLIRFLGVTECHGRRFFLTRSRRDVDGKKFWQNFTSVQWIIALFCLKIMIMCVPIDQLIAKFINFLFDS